MGDEGAAIEGGTRLRVRSAHRGDISAKQIETFFAALSDTCNVVRSAKAAGFSANWAYRKRKTDASFRTGRGLAVREGYAKLELVLLERAMEGTPKLVRTSGGDREMREYSTALAVALLRRHADTADNSRRNRGQWPAVRPPDRSAARDDRAGSYRARGRASAAD